MKRHNIINLLKFYMRMKKLITYTSRAALTMLLLIAGVNQASAGADWIGDSYINVNGSWYTASGPSGDWTSGAFNNYNFGIVTSLTIGGQIQVHDSGNEHWSNGSTCPMQYKIDGDNSDTEGWIELTLYKYGDNGNNMMYQSGGSDFTTISIELSGLTPGVHTLRIFFGPLDNNYDSNYSNNYVATFTVLPGAQTISAGSNGVATYSFAYPLDFTRTTSISAYTVSALSKTAATLTKMEQAVPAGTGLIIMGTSESISPVVSGTSVGMNYLQASVTETEVGDNYAYVLSSGKFHLATAGTIPANRAYLLAKDIPNEARSLSLVFGDESTGISQATNEEWIMGKYYDLSGRRVAQPTKGMYIVNGKKVIVK